MFPAGSTALCALIRIPSAGRMGQSEKHWRDHPLPRPTANRSNQTLTPERRQSTSALSQHPPTPTNAPTRPTPTHHDRLTAPPSRAASRTSPNAPPRRLFVFPLTGPYRFRALPSHTLRRLWRLSFRHASSALTSFCALVWATVFVGVDLVVGGFGSRPPRLPGPVKVALAGAVSIAAGGAPGPPWHASPSHCTGGDGRPGKPPSIRAS